MENAAFEFVGFHFQMLNLILICVMSSIKVVSVPRTPRLFLKFSEEANVYIMKSLLDL